MPAEDGPEPVSIRVSTRDVDFKDPKSVAAFDERLRRAAVAACDSGQPRMLKFVLEDDQCARKAWKDAVRSIDQPILNAMHGQVTMLAQNK